jgi:hypothetical protein
MAVVPPLLTMTILKMRLHEDLKISTRLMLFPLPTVLRKIRMNREK